MGLSLWVASPLVACTDLSARYVAPTDVYPHAVLGDDLEWSALEISGASGGLPKSRISAAADSVFEDIAPRLWDITGDGCPEVIAIESHQAKGARLVVFVVDGDKVDRKVTPHIGTRFRWLAPVAAADFDGDGAIEIAYVDRPHLAKTLRIWRFDRVREELVEVAQARGLTNHRIGEDFITGGLRDCGAGPEMIVVDANWRNIMAVRFEADTVTSRPVGAFKGQASVRRVIACQ